MSTKPLSLLFDELPCGSQHQMNGISWNQALKWFESSTVYPKLLWKGRTHAAVYFCVGMGTDSEHLPTFYIKSFDASQPQWTGYPNSLTYTPHCILEWSPDKTQVFKSTQQKNWTPENENGSMPSHTEQIPSFEEWNTQIETSKQLFRERTLQKIVLARESHVKFANPWAYLERFHEEQPSNYHFAFSPSPASIFLGASPEQLFGLSDLRLTTEALAGTRPVGQSKAERTALSLELTDSTKDQTEHQVVIDYLIAQLSPLSTHCDIGAQEVVQLPTVQHLRTPMHFVLKEGCSVEEIVSQLHPTPAVCGMPKHQAKSIIAELEPFNRGWYAGTMGISHNNVVDFTVLIRSALFIDDIGYAWSGAGIVSDSDPVAEWDELNNKVKQYAQRR